MLLKNIAIVDENFELRQNMNVEIKKNSIAYIGKEMPQSYDGEVYNGEGKLALPGFFNTHCHVPMTLLRGYGEGLPLHSWLLERMLPFEALLTEEDVYWGSLLGIAEMIASGAVSFTDMYFHNNAVLRAVNESGIKANLSRGVVTQIGSSLRFEEEPSYAASHEMLELAAKTGDDKIKIDLAIHAEYTSDAAIVGDVANFAQENKMNIHLHLSETNKEHEECKKRRGMTPAAWFEKLGVFNVPVTAAHCVAIEGEDFEILKRNGATVAHNPSSNLKLGSGIAPVAKMLELGLKVGIGTDGAASNNNLNVLEEINLASMLIKGATQNPLAMNMQTTWQMACLNGAQSQAR